MSSSDRSRVRLVGVGSGGHGRLGASIACLGLGVVVAGCSADFTRLNATGVGLTETSAIPVPSEPVGRAVAGRPSQGDGAYVPPLPRDQAASRRWSDDRAPPSGRSGISSAGLPEPRQPEPRQPDSRQPESRRAPIADASATPRVRSTKRW